MQKLASLELQNSTAQKQCDDVLAKHDLQISNTAQIR